MSKQYSKAPLPFLGQKRNFIKLIRQLDFSGKVVVDLFGGSGIIAHTIKQQNPSARVIYNDFDNYQSRLDQIAITESLRAVLLQKYGHIKKASKLQHEQKVEIMKLIQQSGSTDWITISSWLLFSGKYAHNEEELFAMGWYFRTVQTPLSAEGYLDGVERVHCDFRVLLAEYGHRKDVVFIADPPYIMTNQTGYSAKNDKYFRLKDVIDLVRSIHNQQALFFSSPKSESDALFEVWQPKKIRRTEFVSGIGDGVKAVDYLYYLNCPDDFFDRLDGDVCKRFAICEI